jgi:uncharacterized membrane protein
LEAFSDGVIAILITVMVLELKVPHGYSWAELKGPVSVLGAYVVSFIYLAIYWNNHHHMMHPVKHIDGRSLWANNYLLFWLSLVPFATRWVGESGFATIPVALYGVNLFLSGTGYYVLTRALLTANGRDSEFAQRLGDDFKGKVSLVIYATAVAAAFVAPWIACALYIAVAVIWFIPDRRFQPTD